MTDGGKLSIKKRSRRGESLCVGAFLREAENMSHMVAVQWGDGEYTGGLRKVKQLSGNRLAENNKSTQKEQCHRQCGYDGAQYQENTSYARIWHAVLL